MIVLAVVSALAVAATVTDPEMPMLTLVDLGVLRDVAEDLDRNRVYIPQEDLRTYGADPWRRTADGAWHDLMRFEIARCRDLYANADIGTAMLAPTSQRCIQAARDLYSGILEKIEEANDDVFASRVRVTTTRKLAMGFKLVRPRRFS